jgi:hypothetical protein
VLSKTARLGVFLTRLCKISAATGAAGTAVA